VGIFKKAKVIWGNESKKNTWMCFRKNIILSEIKKTNILNIEVDTKYWLYLNGSLVVREGGLNRESVIGSGYYDQLDISGYLKKGLNSICILVWYWGVSGRNNVDSKQPGLRVECDNLSLFSDDSFLAKRHISYIEPDEPRPSYLYGGHDICYKSDQDFEGWFLPEYEDADWESANICESPVWGEPVKRPVPFHKFSQLLAFEKIISNCQSTKNVVTYECILPYACQLNPYLKIIGNGEEKITIYTDRYIVNGGPGDPNKYRGHKIEYITKKGEQCFESFNWIFGEKVYYIMPESVKILELGYRESGYNCEISGEFKCDDERINILVEKCSRTLYVCMRDNYMDCPDRERGQWIGDVSSQIPQTFYCLSRSADYLSEKAIMDFLNFRKDRVIYGNVPGVNYGELPSQSLNAISDVGLIMDYYRFSGKKEIIEKSYDAARDYLLLWSINKNGLVKPRKGSWAWFDHLENQDKIILENMWYYLALKSAIKMAEICERYGEIKEYESRALGIEKAIENYWTGNCYKSTEIPDDRANGMILISGICPENRTEKIIELLKTTYFATPYMEYYILEGMCKKGYCNEAVERIIERYDGLINNENSTLWEDFHILGTRNHAWSGGPLTILYRYVAGIYPLEPGMKFISIMPSKTKLNRIDACMEISDGILEVSIRYEEKWFMISVKSPSNLKFRVGAPFVNINSIYVNNEKREDYKTDKTHSYVDCEGEKIEFKCEINM